MATVLLSSGIYRFPRQIYEADSESSARFPYLGPIRVDTSSAPSWTARSPGVFNDLRPGYSTNLNPDFFPGRKLGDRIMRRRQAMTSTDVTLSETPRVGHVV
jgi:hypothetical protein